MTDHKTKLIEEQKTLTAELGSLGKKDIAGWEATAEKAEENQADSNESASRFEDFEEKSALMVPLEARLTEVNEALARLEAGTYGNCAVCNNPIEEQRLGANPAARTCMTHINE